MKIIPRSRRHRHRPPEVRFIQDPTVFTTVATMIPDGMHGVHRIDDSLAVESTMKRLIMNGVHPERARALVGRALGRVRGRRVGLLRRGLGDGEEDASLLASVQARGADVQRQHADLIAKIPDGRANGDLLRIRNLIDGLYAAWTDYAVGVKGGAAPYQWNRTDPVDAILIAIRDDLRNTVELLDANKAQQVLAKQIAELPRLGIPGKGGPLFGVDVPWYVWAGGAAAAAAVAGKTLHLW